MTLHKATPPNPDDPTIQNCTFCHRNLHRVPGGSGPTWVHPDGHVMGKPATIDQMWAFVSTDENGTEGIIAGPIGNMPVVPFVAADEDRVDQLRPLAVVLGGSFGVEVKLVKFSNRSDLEEVYKP